MAGARVAKPKSYVPSMADAAVKAKTGRTWAQWFAVLDKTGAAKSDHKGIVRRLAAQSGVSSWWQQMLTVEYERARGKRAPHETSTGFSVAVSKTLAADVSSVYAATANESQRRKWFPAGSFAVSSRTPDKYLRGAWKQTLRLEIGFLAKGAHKAQIALAVKKLGGAGAVATERSAWKAALLRLQSLVED